MKDRIQGLKQYFSDLPEVKRIHELEHYIDTNSEIQTTFSDLKEKQKQMVNAKEYEQWNQYKIYCEEYQSIKEKLFDLPFVEEYLELLEIVDSMLLNVSRDIEEAIDNNINKKI